MKFLDLTPLFITFSTLVHHFSDAQNIDIVDILRIFNIHEEIVAKNITLNTSSGQVVGVHRKVELDRHLGISPTSEKVETEAFYGVPYGVAPGLFTKPVDSNWTEPRDCTKRSDSYQCYQGGEGGTGSVNDCLRVSIQRPVENKADKKALMVWIHGGSYTVGSADGFGGIAGGNNYLYDPVTLVGKGDVIVASIDYRLDALGFFDNMELPGNSHLKGNYALYDVVKAIDWLIENADEIGFDKDRITIFGQSAGGSLTSWTASLSALKGKIQRVIPVSGQVSMFFGSHKFSGSNTNAATELASKNHCMFPHAEDMVECMKNQPAYELNQGGHTNISWRPSNDGELVTDNDGLNQFKLFSKDVDVMVGHTCGDAVIFAYPYQGKSGLYKAMTDFAPDVSPWPENEFLYGVELGVHWSRQFYAPTKDLSYTRGVIDALNKMLFGRGVVRLAKEHNQLQGTGKTFVYRYDVKSILASLADNVGPDPLPDCGDPIEHNGRIESTCGAIHGEDILYFMGKMELKKSALVHNIALFNDTITDGRLELASRSVEAFSNFAKYGDPNGANSRNGLYPEFDPSDPKLLSYRDADSRNPDQEIDVDVYDFYDYYDGLEEVAQIRMNECESDRSARKHDIVTSDLLLKFEMIKILHSKSPIFDLELHTHSQKANRHVDKTLSDVSKIDGSNINIVDILRVFNIHEEIVANNVTLDTASGPVFGVHRKVQLDRNLGLSPRAESIETEAFYGVPYGIVPGLFEKPVDSNWSEPKDCTERSESYQCYQSGGGSVFDCLRLSIHRPVKNREEKKALMVWIHGGAYTAGSADGFNKVGSNNWLNDPVALVAKGDVIVASLNYRLDAFGFFDNSEMPGDEHLKGNYALYDLVKAIDWLIENANSIGFDKNRITIFGQSAGGSLTSWTASLSALHGKIQRIIPVAGQVSMFFGSHQFSGSNIEVARELASENHCMFPNSDDMVDCIKGKPEYEINAMVKHTNASWRPSNDGELVTDNDGFNQFKLFSKDVDVFVGHVCGDAVIFAFEYEGEVGAYDAVKLIIPDISPWPLNEYSYLSELGVHWTRQFEALTKDLSYTRGVINGYTKMLFGRGVVKLAEQHTKLQGTGKTFVYRHDMKSILTDIVDVIGIDPLPNCGTPFEHNGEVEESCGAIHGEDVVYFMGKMMLKKSALFSTISQGRLDLSSRTVEAFANFAKYGDPNGENNRTPIYPEFDSNDPKLLSYRDSESRNPDQEMNVDVYDFSDFYDGFEEVVQIRLKECVGEDRNTVTSVFFSKYQ